jgi:hypothetical protein
MTMYANYVCLMVAETCYKIAGEQGVSDDLTNNLWSCTEDHCIYPSSDYIKIADRFFDNVGKFKYLGMITTNQNLINEEIKADWIWEKLARISSGPFLFLSAV